MSFYYQVTSLFSGLVVFSILGFMAHTNGLTVEVSLLIQCLQQFTILHWKTFTLPSGNEGGKCPMFPSIYYFILEDILTSQSPSGNEGGKWSWTCIHCLSRGGHPASCTSGSSFHNCIWVCICTCIWKLSANYPNFVTGLYLYRVFFLHWYPPKKYEQPLLGEFTLT